MSNCERDLEINCLEIDVKDFESDNDELRERIVSKKNKKRIYVEKMRNEINTKDGEIVHLRIQILNSNHKLSWTEKCNADLRSNLAQGNIHINKLEKKVRHTTGQGQSQGSMKVKVTVSLPGKVSTTSMQFKKNKCQVCSWSRRHPRQGCKQKGYLYPNN